MNKLILNESVTMSSRESQNKVILKCLQSGYSINPMEALRRFGCSRLAARIFDLRKKGYCIQSRTLTANKKRYSEYVLAKADAN